MPLIVFDGVCGLCNSWVDFVLRHDRRAVFQFTPYQSETGRQILGGHGPVGADSIVLVDGERTWRESSAVLEILRRLGGPWRMASWARIVPRPLRDSAYRFVAARRYRWFGQRETCRIPTPAERSRFV